MNLTLTLTQYYINFPNKYIYREIIKVAPEINRKLEISLLHLLSDKKETDSSSTAKLSARNVRVFLLFGNSKIGKFACKVYKNLNLIMSTLPKLKLYT